MTVEADAVTGAMRQTRNFVVGTKAGVGDHFACRGIDRFARRADLRGGKARILRFALKAPDVALSLRRFPENESARDVGLITFDAASAVHQHDIAFVQFLRRAAAVRKCGVLAKAAKDSPLHAEVAQRGGTVAGK